MTSQQTLSSHPSDTELMLTRVFDAPRMRVWRAWADPSQAVRWWGPNGFTTTTEKHDFRVGGGWKYVMHGPDGTDYPNSSVYVEIEEGKRLVYRHGGGREEGPGASFVATVEFADEGGPNRTRITMRMKFAAADAKALVMREFGAEEGGKQHLARLSEFLYDGEGKPFVITRTFDAPIDRVWRAWTEPERMAQWWGPRGATTTMKAFELRPGGVWHCMLQMPGQPPMWGKYVFREVTPNHRLVFVVAFADEAGNLRKHPMSPDWPLEILSTVEFAGAGGKTSVTVTWRPINATEVERKTFADGAESMRGGWTGTLDRFESYITLDKERA